MKRHIITLAAVLAVVAAAALSAQQAPTSAAQPAGARSSTSCLNRSTCT